MKSFVVRLLSVFLVFAILCSFLPATPANASSALDPNELLDDLLKKREILDSIDKYFSRKSDLKKSTVVFFFEGGSNSKKPYKEGGTRDQAVAVVTKKGKVTYVETKCSTIPDIPDKNYGTSPSAANVIDGIYRFKGVIHKSYNAFRILNLDKTDGLPCVRFNTNDKTYIIKKNATAINIHGRSSCDSTTSKSPNSAGCILVGNNMDKYAKFRSHITNNDWKKGTYYGYVVIDRSLARTALAESGLYKNYPHAVDALLGKSFLNIELKDIGKLNQGTSHNIIGNVSSNCNITEITGKILSGSTVLQSETIKPNTACVNLKSSKINSKLKFGSLAAGSYKLQISAKNASSKTVTSSVSFTVSKDLTISLDSIGTISKGSACNIVGTVSSYYKITKVTGEILSGSTVKQSVTITPNTTSVNLKSSKINSNLKFGKLAKGTYTLKITATDANKKTVTKSITFKVK